jgi:alkaline phosphatase D
LQDWCLAGGRLECVHAAADRNVHLLVRTLGAGSGGFDLKVRVGRVDGSTLAGPGSVGFRIGIRGPLPDFRNALAFGQGLDAGLTAEGGLFIGAVGEATPGAIKLDLAEAQLRLTGRPESDGYALTLSVSDKS